MDFEPRHFIPLVIVTAGAIVLGLSYVAAYMLGRDHARRSEERSLRSAEQLDAVHRISAIETAVNGLSNSVERLMDAQRLIVAQQDHLSRKVGVTDRNLGFGSAQGRNTPA